MNHAFGYVSGLTHTNTIEDECIKGYTTGIACLSIVHDRKIARNGMDFKAVWTDIFPL